jgi:hypothetical protein
MIKAVLNAAEVKARLLAMSEKSRKNTFKRAMRKVAKPVVLELRKAWTGARRRQGKVTGEIARAQRATVDMKKDGVGLLKIGTDYKVGGYAKIWHILENGFKHYGKNATYQPAGREVREAKAARAEYFKAALGDPKALRAQARTKAGRDELKAKYRAVRAGFMQANPEKERVISSAWASRRERRDAARKSGGNRSVLGRRISRPIAQKHVRTIAVRFRDELAREVLGAARGRKAAA